MKIQDHFTSPNPPNVFLPNRNAMVNKNYRSPFLWWRDMSHLSIDIQIFVSADAKKGRDINLCQVS